MVSYEKDHRFSDRCGCRSLHFRRAIDHVLHLLITVVSGGMWALVWIYLALNRDQWKCEECGCQWSGRF